MKDGTACAARLKKVWKKCRSEGKPPDIPDLRDPMRCLALGILGAGVSDIKSEKAVDRILAVTVDWNEVRVCYPSQIADIVSGLVPKPLSACQRLIDALHDIYDRENIISLDRLHGIGRREARQYLEELAGTDEYAVATIVLWALGGHAIPVNNGLLDALTAANLVNPSATRAEVQAFLERHISAGEAKEFVIRMRSFTVPKPADKKARARTKKSAES